MRRGMSFSVGNLMGTYIFFVQTLFSFIFCSLVIASEYDPGSIIEKLAPYLGGSASIVVYSPHIQVCKNSILRTFA